MQLRVGCRCGRTRAAQGIDFEVRISGPCRCVGMTEQLADDRQPKSGGRSKARMCVSKVMETHTYKAGPFCNGSPRAVQVKARCFILAAGRLSGNHK
jgi:hypothetical protein